MTWGDVEKFVKKAGLDKSEYFHIDVPSMRDQVVWDEKGIRWIAVWWVRGGSEGWYVHVERVVSHGERIPAMLGKFWSAQEAAAAATALTRLFYGEYKDISELYEA